MKPLSPLKRRVYLILFAALFCAVVPLALLFAGGWQYKSGYGFVQIGGIFVSVPVSNASITLNGKEVGVSGFFDRTFYLSDLAPSSYVLQVERDGYYAWSRTIVVEPQIVTVATVVMVPKDIRAMRLVPVTQTPVASTSRAVSAAEYRALLAAFDIAATSSVARGGTVSGALLSVEDGDVLLKWPHEDRRPPDNFCGRPSFCASEIELEGDRPIATSAVFFGDGVVYATRTGGIFFTDPDIRPTQLVVPLYAHGGTDVRVVGGRLIVHDEDELYEIEGL